MTIKEFIEVYDQIELEKEQGLKSGTRLPAGMRKSISGESPRATSGRAGVTGGSNSARSNK